ncbi:MAG: acyltransferase family protein [Muribaculaceae bacterium]|nr:acyltransferase family protein [Muribaculaceae bacterium]
MLNLYKEIDILKGIAIILVVLGHIELLYALDAYSQFRDFVYTFHMPLFMAISGYLYAKHHNMSFNYLSFIKKKAKRLLLPYISVMAIYYLIKYILSYAVGLNTPIELKSFLYTLFVNPYGGFVSFLWYVYVLFLIYLIVPIFKRLSFLLAISVVIYFIPFPSMFCLDLLSEHLVFFVLGVLLYKYHSKGKELNVKNLLIPSLILQILLYLYSIQHSNLIFNFMLALLGIVSTYSLSKIITDFRLPTLRYIGKYSTEIYFLHVIFLLGVITLFKLVPCSFNGEVYVQLLVQFLAGVIGPLLFAMLLRTLKVKRLYQILFGKNI